MTRSAMRRYLQGEPIVARRPSGLYVLRKKLRKHSLLVSLAAAAVALALTGVVGGVWWKERELARAHRLALRTLQSLERPEAAAAIGDAQALFDRYPELPEAALVQARAISISRRGVQPYYAGIKFLEDILKDDPARWECRALLAEFWRQAGEPERAAALEAQAEREAPDTAEAWYLRSFATFERQRALQYAQEAVQRDSSHVLAWDRLTHLRMETGDLDGALVGAEKLIELGEDVNEWTIVKGAVFAKRGEFEKAIQAYSRARAPALLAHTYRRMGEYEKAVECYDTILEQMADESRAGWHYYQRATPLWILGRNEDALEDCRRARKLLGRPSYGDARWFLILRQQGEDNEAQKVLNAALREVEDDWLRQIFRCLNGELSSEALVLEGKARDDPEQLCEAYYYAAEACLLAGDRDKARQWFEQCVQTGVVFDPNAAAGTPMNECELARWRLKTLFGSNDPTSPP
jgi:tetratricopeptide (TPR) repeat protein